MKLEMYALYRMIYECCGEDQDVLENAEISKIAPNKYHIAYKENNPYEGISFDVEISIIPNPSPEVLQHMSIAHYSITNSVYGDDGEFDIEL